MFHAFASSPACPAAGLCIGAAAHWQGSVPARRVVDEATGRVCVDVAEAVPAEPGEIWTEFEDPGLDRYDVLRFRWKMAGDPAAAVVSIEGYPAPDGRRNYYLMKRPNPPGRWQEVWLDLRHDDDGAALAKAEVPRGKLRLRFEVLLTDMGRLPDRPRVLFHVADIRFVRFPVAFTGDLASVTSFQEGDRVGQRYLLTLANRTGKTQEVRLWTDPGALREFSVALPEAPIRLASGESRQVTAAIALPRERAVALPPLACEEAGVFAGVEGDPEATPSRREGPEAARPAHAAGRRGHPGDAHARLHPLAPGAGAGRRAAAGGRADNLVRGCCHGACRRGRPAAVGGGPPGVARRQGVAAA